MFEIVTMATDLEDKSPTTINRANKARMYSMDLSILKCIEAGMNEKDKEEADAVVVKRIVYLLNNLLNDNYNDVSQLNLHEYDTFKYRLRKSTQSLCNLREIYGQHSLD